MARNKPTLRQLHQRLERASTALVRSATISLIAGRPWPKRSSVPAKQFSRVVDLLNAIIRHRTEKYR